MSLSNELNRIHNCTNPNQGEYKRVLCVCSAGLLRSPTAALVLSQPPFNFNTRAVGIVSQFALVPIDKVLISWANEIVCMEQEHADSLRKMTTKNVICLDIPDTFQYRDEGLQWLIGERYTEKTKGQIPEAEE